MTEGYIKLHRSIEEWEWSNNPIMYYFWVRLLVVANYKDKEWQGKVIPRGTIITSVAKLAADFSLSVKQVRCCLERLTKGKQIVTQTTNKWTKITICNYDTYQCSEETKGQTKGKQNGTERANERATTKEDNTSSSTTVDSEDIIQEERKKDSGTYVPSQKEIVDRLYAIYPATAKRPEGNRVALRSAKDKDKLARLLANGHTEEQIEATIRRYVADTNPPYLKMFSTFLNNLPDYSYPELTEQPDLGAALRNDTRRNNKTTFTFEGVKRG